MIYSIFPQHANMLLFYLEIVTVLQIMNLYGKIPGVLKIHVVCILFKNYACKTIFCIKINLYSDFIFLLIFFFLNFKGRATWYGREREIFHLVSPLNGHTRYGSG